MNLPDGYTGGTSRTGSKVHILSTDGTTSILILGSEEYDADTHDRALCGTISEFDTDVDTDVGEDGACYACVRKAYKKGFIDDPEPFDVDRIGGVERPA